jgi:serine protease AprX
MPLDSNQVLQILYPGCVEGRSRRFTQDTPVLPDVWIRFAGNIHDAHELLLTPHRTVSAAELARDLDLRLNGDGASSDRGSTNSRAAPTSVSFNDSHVCVSVTFEQLIRDVLPLSEWWRTEIGGRKFKPNTLAKLEDESDLRDLLLEPAKQDEHAKFPENVLNLVRIIGAISLGKPLPDSTVGSRGRERGEARAAVRMHDWLVRVVREARRILAKVNARPLPTRAPLWSVFTNRQATAAISLSRACVKADAAVHLFDIRCDGIRFAILDSGIDAAHVAFRRQNAKPPVADQESEPVAPASRVVKTLDFTQLKGLMTIDVDGGDSSTAKGPKPRLSKAQEELVRRDIRQRLRDGRPLDWSVLEPALELPCTKESRPINEHGTHVAGILGASWRDRLAADGKSEPLVGICKDIELYDLRVIGPDGTGDEFCILAALQYVRYLNQSKGRMVIHGVNLSLSIPHLASSFACGQTPICDEVNRLVNNGVVVVTAAGNGGYGGAGVAGAGDYRDISVTDPGNADLAITVGATHRNQPHRYGVSYFSSRGPTGDGRMKPDLVAPGEQILSTVPGDKCVVLDGTSMAAPHVSGAAALLMARHRELVGEPRRIKEILCGSATDLGRARDFQGSGLLDILRALQTV